jgi:protein-tyrosine phosphatase
MAAEQLTPGPERSLAALMRCNYGTHRGFVRTLLGEAEFLLGRLDAHLIPAQPERIQRLVFVCLGNINRSAFANAVAEDLGLRTCSIGLSTTTGAPAFQMAVTTARQFGYSLDQHRATDRADHLHHDGDYYLVMETRHLRQLRRAGIPAHQIGMLGHWSRPHRIHLHDPHTLSEAYFQTCFAQLHAAVHGLHSHLTLAASPAAAHR